MIWWLISDNLNDYQNDTVLKTYYPLKLFYINVVDETCVKIIPNKSYDYISRILAILSQVDIKLRLHENVN